MLAYHYCALHQLPSGSLAYNHGVLDAHEVITAAGYPDALNRIAKGVGVDPQKITVLSLTRL